MLQTKKIRPPATGPYSRKEREDNQRTSFFLSFFFFFGGGGGALINMFHSAQWTYAKVQVNMSVPFTWCVITRGFSHLFGSQPLCHREWYSGWGEMPTYKYGYIWKIITNMGNTIWRINCLGHIHVYSICTILDNYQFSETLLTHMRWSLYVTNREQTRYFETHIAWPTKKCMVINYCLEYLRYFWESCKLCTGSGARVLSYPFLTRNSGVEIPY